MVTAESLCCGTPVIGFRAGGPESIALVNYSDFVEYGNVHQIVSAILNMDFSLFNKKAISENSQRVYSQENMAEKYLKIYS